MRVLVLTVAALLLTATTAPAVEKAAIDKAVDDGVAALKKLQRNDGTWPHEKIGATALAGLTLLECGVPADDKSVQNAARAVRAACLRLTHVYSLSAAVWFLDRLDAPEDTPLIEAMLIRLMAGQSRSGM